MMFRNPIARPQLSIRVLPRRTLRSGNPPTYFADPSSPPQQYGVPPSEHNTSQNTHHKDEFIPPPEQKRPAGELSALIAMFSLAYLAIDNYSSRVKLEKLNQESTALHMKTLQLQQQNYARATKQQELRMIKERSETSKRCFKMSMHIAMLRKQLLDNGIEPKDINDVAEEFEKNVKMNTSIHNVTGNAIWLNDSSEYSGHLPNYREYDGKGN